jgi:hypothetical protein
MYLCNLTSVEQSLLLELVVIKVVDLVVVVTMVFAYSFGFRFGMIFIDASSVTSTGRLSVVYTKAMSSEINSRS